MKIGVIGANGKLGKLVCEEALRRGHEVYGIVRREDYVNDRITIIRKDLFALSVQDISDLDALIATYGGGLDADPELNKKAIVKSGNIAKDAGKHLIYVGGAGCLFVDSSHIMHVFESDSHPKFLKEISRNIYLGYLELKEMNELKYTFVCPSINFDYDAPRYGVYQVGTSLEPLKSKRGESKIGYSDMAIALIDEAENRRYLSEMITICEL